MKVIIDAWMLDVYESWLNGVSLHWVSASLRLQLHQGGRIHNELRRGPSQLIEFGWLCS